MSPEEVESAKRVLIEKLDRVEEEIATTTTKLEMLAQELTEVTGKIMEMQAIILADEIEDYLGG